MAGLLEIFITACCFAVCVQGDYVLKVRVHDYNNPIQSGVTRGTAVCCDGNDRPCDGGERCDSRFEICLKVLGNREDGTRSCVHREIRSFVNSNDGTAVSEPTWLGLNNPFNVTGISTAYEDAQLYIEVLDSDGFNDPLIDQWRIEESLTVGDTFTTSTAYPGIHGYATITLSLQVVCAENYFGAACENLNECLSQSIDCSNQGQCIDGDGMGICICDPGFSGDLCEININDCQAQTCNGNGQCIDGVNSFSCGCDPGFAGSLCEINIDECVGVTCSGNGQCMDEVNGFSCACQLGYIGQLCDSAVDYCEGETCSGNGTCVNGSDTYTCYCFQGYTGVDCEVDIDDCAGMDCSLNGQCVDLVGVFRCDCQPGFTGQLCNMEDDETAIIGGVVGAIAVIMITVALLVILRLWWWKRAKQALTQPPPYDYITTRAPSLEQSTHIYDYIEAKQQQEDISAKPNIVYGIPLAYEHIDVEPNVVYGTSQEPERTETDRAPEYIDLQPNVVYGMSQDPEHIEMQANVVYGH